jgi:tRNA A-37 threonylcarbamoyl transferase component Bud32
MATWIEPWIGFDLDGVLANDSNMSASCEIGPPIQKTIDKIKQLRREGKQVKIITSRVDGNVSARSKEELNENAVIDLPKVIADIERWCLQNIGEVLLITDAKDCGMQLLYDDKVVRVNANTGELCTGCRHYLMGVEQATFKKKLGDYYEVEEIGGGVHSIVYRAFKIYSEYETYCLKRIRDKYLNDEIVMKQFEVECEVSEIICNEQVVQIDGVNYLEMPYIIGATNLEDELKQGKKFTIDQTLDILTPIAEGLDKLHFQRICHCDIKPRNILTVDYGEPTLIDFGVAQFMDIEYYFKVDNMWGTVMDYIAPEIARGERATPYSDQFMLAATAFEMITGDRYSHYRKSLQSLTEVLVKAFDKALDIEPKNRFRSCVEFVEALGELVNVYK